MKILFSIPEDDLKKIDKAVKEHKVTRSHFIRKSALFAIELLKGNYNRASFDFLKFMRKK